MAIVFSVTVPLYPMAVLKSTQSDDFADVTVFYLSQDSAAQVWLGEEAGKIHDSAFSEEALSRSLLVLGHPSS